MWLTCCVWMYVGIQIADDVNTQKHANYRFTDSVSPQLDGRGTSYCTTKIHNSRSRPRYAFYFHLCSHQAVLMCNVFLGACLICIAVTILDLDGVYSTGLWWRW